MDYLENLLYFFIFCAKIVLGDLWRQLGRSGMNAKALVFREDNKSFFNHNEKCWVKGIVFDSLEEAKEFLAEQTSQELKIKFPHTSTTVTLGRLLAEYLYSGDTYEKPGCFPNFKANFKVDPNDMDMEQEALDGIYDTLVCMGNKGEVGGSVHKRLDPLMQKLLSQTVEVDQEFFDINGIIPANEEVNLFWIENKKVKTPVFTYNGKRKIREVKDKLNDLPKKLKILSYVGGDYVADENDKPVIIGGNYKINVESFEHLLVKVFGYKLSEDGFYYRE